MAVLPNLQATTVLGFLTRNVAPSSTVYTDGYPAFARLHEAGMTHIPRTQPLRSALHRGARSAVPLADRAIGNLQQWLTGTYHGVSKAQLPVYLDEFVFRTTVGGNRRPLFRHYWVSGPDVLPRPIDEFEVLGTSRPVTANHHMLGCVETTG